MRKIVVPVFALFILASCAQPDNSRPQPAGKGVVVEVEHEAIEYYSKRECEKKYGKGSCRVPRVKSPEHWEVDYLDANTGEEVEVVVSRDVADGCVGKFSGDQRFFNGTSCQAA